VSSTEQATRIQEREIVNTPPHVFRLVPHEALGRFAAEAGRHAGLPEDRASQLAELLVANDLRGVFSHGTVQIATYARLMRDRRLNSRPAVHVVRETPVSVLVDGDGGLGYFPAADGTARVIAKANESGIAVMVSRNHGHFGAAGIYARMAVGHDLLCYVTSGHQLLLQPGQPLYDAGGGSPMAFTAPADAEDPVVLDFGAMHDLYGGRRDELAQMAPGLVLRSIGLGEICQAWGGLLSGLRIDPEPPVWNWPGANQGALVVCFRIDLFTDPRAFRQEIDAYVRRVRELQPLTGFDRCFMPGGLEAARERQYRAEGVPVGPEHQARLELLAEELGIAVPWS
jgi:L-2-hydroxycarboxylate dehydrogenase (NAD+)